LCRKIAGPGEILSRHEQRIFIIKALRIGLFFVGLMMLPAAFYYISRIPSFIDSAFNNIIEGEKLVSSFGKSFRRQYLNIFGLFKALLAFYLIFGASAFIRWQANRSLHTVPDSERTEK
ncbi:MAG: hypothetical protein PVH77_08830, partial [Phycisphaerales bacterium]